MYGKFLQFLLVFCLGITSCFAELMLAQSYKNEDVSSWLASEKLDGVRAYWDGKRLISRLGNEFTNYQEFTQGFPDFALDGELWIARSKFEQTVSQIKRGEWTSITFNIFDVPEQNGGLLKRLAVLENYLAENPQLRNKIKIIEQQPISDISEAKKMLKKIEKLGGEGIVLRDPYAPYIEGRSAKMLKFKTREDAECKVIAHIPGKGRNIGRLGSILCKNLSDGQVFKIGTGFSDLQRENPPPIGTIITYKYSGLTAKSKPRFASFWRLREE